MIRPALVQAFLDGLHDRPGKQVVALKALRQLERWAIVRDMLHHPITLGVEVEGSDGGHVPWTDEHVALAEMHAQQSLARTVTLAANTGQRASDLIKMRWTDLEEYNGRMGVNVIQKKTGRQIWIPLTLPLIQAMTTWERRPGFILLRQGGTAWTRKGLTGQWSRERAGNPLLRPLLEAGLARSTGNRMCEAPTGGREHPADIGHGRDVGENGRALHPVLGAAGERLSGGLPPR